MPDLPDYLGDRGRTRLLVGAIYVVVTTLIFLLGIWIGRDVADRHPIEPARVAMVDAPERPLEGDLPKPAGRTFFDDFREGVYNSLEVGEEGETAAATPTKVPPTATQARPTKARPTVAKKPTQERRPTIRPTATRRRAASRSA